MAISKSYAEFDAAIRGNDAEASVAAMRALDDYYEINRTERLMLRAKRKEAYDELDLVRETPPVDQQLVWKLESLLHYADSRLQVMESKRNAFEDSLLYIRPPKQSEVDAVKDAAAAASNEITNAVNADKVMIALLGLAKAVDKIEG